MVEVDYIDIMLSVDKVIADAKQLSREERARVAHEMILSLDDEPADDGVEEAWAVEIARRARAVEDGTAVLEDWTEVRRRIRGAVAKTAVTIHIDSAASEEVDEAALWYEGQRPGLGLDYLATIDAAFATIAENAVNLAGFGRVYPRISLSKYGGISCDVFHLQSPT